MTYPTPTGLHTPVTNVTIAAPEAVEKLISASNPGSGAPIDPRGEVEALKPEIRYESSVAAAAPKTDKLRDIGAASFADPGMVLETVHGRDDRLQVSDTDKFPWRVNASLLITARDGSQWVGTAWFVSPRTLITAGHCVNIKGSGLPTRDGWVKSIQVMPGRNGTALPYGSVTSSQFWSVKGWTESGDENYDYAAIILPVDLGTTVGVMGFATLSDADLTASVANVAGYPGDKDSGTLWYDTKKVASLSASKIYYDIDTYGGQSGAAVYVIQGAQRIAVAVHAYGGPTTNSGTRISSSVFANLSNWKQ